MNKVIRNHEDSLVIKTDIDKDWRVSKVLVDNGSVMGILYYSCFNKIDYKK